MVASGEIMVKICGITSEADALLAVGLGADALGFVLAPSVRQMAPGAVADIVKRLPPSILTVGVFRDESPQRVVDITNHIGLGAVQLHGHEPATQSRWIRQRVARTIKAFAAGDPDIARFEEYGADHLLVDGASPGSGAVFDWRLAEGVVDPSRLIVAGGLDPTNVAQAVAHLRPYGVDVSTGVEASPGTKDPKLVGDFIVAARRAADQLVGPGTPGGDPDDAPPGPYDWMEG
ncbi:MAG TPA: phosphoribosylanthranilate isomerase [Acidimicrobiales bacterium]|jgi:phosphoribosylanthranilate isomerase